MITKVSPDASGVQPTIRKLGSFLQLIGLVWKKNSLTNTILVLLWNMIILGNCGYYIYPLIGDDNMPSGLVMLVTSYALVTALYAIAGTFTLAALLHDKNNEMMRGPPLSLALWSAIIAASGTLGMILLALFYLKAEVLDILSPILIDLAILATNAKTIFIAGSTMATFQTKCLSCPTQMIFNKFYCQELVSSFRKLKLGMAPVLLNTFLSLTCIMIFGSYSAYIILTCVAESPTLRIISIIDLTLFAGNAAVLLYLCQLAEDTFGALTEVKHHLR